MISIERIDSVMGIRGNAQTARTYAAPSRCGWCQRYGRSVRKVLPTTAGMLLTLSSTTAPAADLSFLLKKHPDRLGSFALPFGTAYVFYPDVSNERCTAALMIAVDPIGLVRGRPTSAAPSGLVDAYVNDRPYVASSFLSVAIARVLGAALGGRSDREELIERRLQLTATLSPIGLDEDDLPVRLFGPLGYDVETSLVDVPAVERVGAFRSITLAALTTVQQMLAHLYVLVPVLDGEKHYWVGDEEVEKLLRFGGDWLASHPERDLITRRYLKRAPSLARAAIARLGALDDAIAPAKERRADDREDVLERPMRLQDRRVAAVIDALRDVEATSVADIGCGEGDLLAALAREDRVKRIVGTDVSVRELERAKARLERASMPISRRERIELFQSSVLYADRRLIDIDALTLLEVIEHIDAARLMSLERVVFAYTRPRHVLVTTPNREYNVLFPTLQSGRFRHADHRFEWTRDEFAAWAGRVGAQFGYAVAFLPIGDEDATVGAPTQMAVFRCI